VEKILSSALMKTFKTILLTIVFTLPFLCADLYTKHLAHTELPNEGDKIVLIEPLYAESPLRNYGSGLTNLFGIENSKEHPNTFAHLLFLPVIILGAYSAFHAVGGGIASILWFMFLGGALGNGIEVLIFGGATDFLSTNTGNPSFDRWVFNVADIFIFIPLLFCIIPFIYLSVTLICEYYIYEKLLLPIFKKIGIIYTPAPPKYSEELTLEVVKRYKVGETLEEIAIAVGKTPNSIRGKLVSEKVYTQYKEVNFRISQMTNAEIEPLNLTQGMEYAFDDTTQYLNEAGYIRVSQVNKEGYYSVKGGLIKVHPFGSEEAITLDYFGDTIETIKVVSKDASLPSIRISPYQLGVT
jgi:lipoprotein signal peptidase